MPGEPAGGQKPRYETLFQLASGGMASVFLGTARGGYGFRQLVAIKKPHAYLLVDPAFKKALVTEARLVSLLHHANVVDVRDVEVLDDSVSLVMDYIEGASLAELVNAASKTGSRLSPGVAIRIVLDACAGLHAAHELKDERERALNLVHRDISPQNILVGVDGIARVADFGVAKFQKKQDLGATAGLFKGKIAYMAPEYVTGAAIDRRADVFAMGVVLWEAVAGQRLFRGKSDGDTVERVMSMDIPSLASVAPDVGTAFDDIVHTALARDRERRFETAAAMATALESSAKGAGALVGPRDVAETVKSAVGEKLDDRRKLVRARLANEPSVASVVTLVTDVHARPKPAATTAAGGTSEETGESVPATTTMPKGKRPEELDEPVAPTTRTAAHATPNAEAPADPAPHARAAESTTARAAVPAAPAASDDMAPASLPTRQSAGASGFRSSGSVASNVPSTLKSEDDAPPPSEAIILPMTGASRTRVALVVVLVMMAAAWAVTSFRTSSTHETPNPAQAGHS